MLGAFLGSADLEIGLFIAVAGSALWAFSLRSQGKVHAMTIGAAILCGSLYAAASRTLSLPKIRASADGAIEAIVTNDPVPGERSQRFTVSFAAPSHGRAEVIAPRFPETAYGDRVRFPAAELRPGAGSGPMSPFLARKIAIVGRGGGSPLRTALIRLNHAVLSGFRMALPADEAALLGGLLLGDRASFSAGFRDAMQKSGTTHIVAVSGYNISLVALAVGAIMRQFLARRAAFLGSVAAIALFALMTGGEASVIRAAIMGCLLLLARFSGREADVWRMMAFAAALMTAVDPALPRFDLGFQLSFASLAGIVALEPVFRRLLRAEAQSLLGWRSALAASAAAQAAVAPLLIHAFGTTSLISLIANMAILPAVPPVMMIGALAAGCGALSHEIAAIVLWSAYGFLAYMVRGILFFGSLSGPFTISFSGIWFAVLYYAILLAIAVSAQARNAAPHDPASRIP